MIRSVRVLRAIFGNFYKILLIVGLNPAAFWDRNFFYFLDNFFWISRTNFQISCSWIFHSTKLFSSFSWNVYFKILSRPIILFAPASISLSDWCHRKMDDLSRLVALHKEQSRDFSAENSLIKFLFWIIYSFHPGEDDCNIVPG